MKTWMRILVATVLTPIIPIFLWVVCRELDPSMYGSLADTNFAEALSYASYLFRLAYLMMILIGLPAFLLLRRLGFANAWIHIFVGMLATWLLFWWFMLSMAAWDGGHSFWQVLPFSGELFSRYIYWTMTALLCGGSAGFIFWWLMRINFLNASRVNPGN